MKNALYDATLHNSVFACVFGPLSYAHNHIQLGRSLRMSKPLQRQSKRKVVIFTGIDIEVEE